MKRLLMTLAILLGTTIIAGGAYLVGYTQAFWAGEERLRDETAGNLAYRVDTLCRLRTDRRDSAIEHIEQSVDMAIRTLPGGQGFVDMSKNAQEALTMAKLYRTAFPTDATEVNAILQDVPDLPVDRNYCNEALRDVAQIAKSRKGG